MSDGFFTLKFDFSSSGFKQQIYKGIKKILSRKLPIISKNVSLNIRKRFSELILNHKVVQNLIIGDLRGEIGVTNAQSRIETIIKAWTRGLILENKPIQICTNGLSGGFKLKMVQSDWSEVLRLREAIVVERTAEPLEWLDWLLTRGCEIIIQDYDYAVQIGSGRTGLGHMRKDYMKKRWSVPAEFAGVQDNNFVSDAINMIHKEAQMMIRKEFYKVL